VLAFLEPGHQGAPAVFAEHRAADLGVVQIAVPEVDEGFRVAREANLLALHGQPLDGAFADQRRPVEAASGIDEARRRSAGRLEKTDLPGNGAARCHHHLVLGDDGDGGAGDGVEADDVLVGARVADLDLIADELAEVLLVEADQRRLGDAEQQDGFGVFEDLHAGEAAAGVDADQRDHRLARVGRDVGDVGRQHDVAEEGAAPVVFGKALDVARLPLALGEDGGAGQHLATGNELAERRRAVDPGRQPGLVSRLRARRRRDEKQGGQEESATGREAGREAGRKPGSKARPPRRDPPLAGEGARRHDRSVHGRQGAYASTIIRLRISRCSAWQKWLQ
jgi:hypothetical protein